MNTNLYGKEQQESVNQRGRAKRIPQNKETDNNKTYNNKTIMTKFTIRM